MKSLDGFNPQVGWIKVDEGVVPYSQGLRVEEAGASKSRFKETLSKKGFGEVFPERKEQVKDYVHKLTSWPAETFNGYTHVFEDLRKERMLKGSKRHNRDIMKSNWKMIQSFLAYKSRVKLLNPKNSSRRCSKCGMLNAPKGATYVCKRCGLRINRQLNAAVNLYIQMEGLPPSLKLFEEFWGGAGSP